VEVGYPSGWGSAWARCCMALSGGAMTRCDRCPRRRSLCESGHQTRQSYLCVLGRQRTASRRGCTHGKLCRVWCPTSHSASTPDTDTTASLRRPQRPVQHRAHADAHPDGYPTSTPPSTATPADHHATPVCGTKPTDDLRRGMMAAALICLSGLCAVHRGCRATPRFVDNGDGSITTVTCWCGRRRISTVRTARRLQ